ncbi:hypothetical protein M8J77_002533 [Diaphorina citri]|nr:hypothetical protein M8J77_002533 [Diaphorina citri]
MTFGLSNQQPPDLKSAVPTTSLRKTVARGHSTMFLFDWIHNIPRDPRDWHMPHLAPWAWVLIVFSVAKKVVVGGFLLHRWRKRKAAAAAAAENDKE